MTLQHGYALEVEGIIKTRDGELIQEIDGISVFDFVKEKVRASLQHLITPEELPFNLEFMNSKVHATPDEAVGEALQIYQDINSDIKDHGLQIVLQPIPTEDFTIQENLLSQRATELINQNLAWRELLKLTSCCATQWNISTQFQDLSRLEKLAVTADIYNQYQRNLLSIEADFNKKFVGFNGKTRFQNLQHLLSIVASDIFPEDPSQGYAPGPFYSVDELLIYFCLKSGSETINSKMLHSLTIKAQGSQAHFTIFNPHATEHRIINTPSAKHFEAHMLEVARRIEVMNSTARANISNYI